MALSPEKPSYTADLAAARKLGFPILFDDGNRVAAQFGLTFSLPDDLRAVYRGFGIDLDESNSAGWTLPMPARYVVDAGRIIRSVDADPDYTRRPEPVDTLAFARDL